MKKIAAFILTLLLVWSCSDDTPSGPDVDDFDREALLENWADNIIIPSFTDFSEKTEALHASAAAFEADPTQQNLETLRERWKTAYMGFQHVSMFEMGQAMDLRYRDNMNLYPTDTEEIERSIEAGSYNLTLPSFSDSQGFPALDYMLFGLADSDADLLAFYTTNANAENYLTYLTDLTERIDGLTTEVLDNWTSGYRDTFVSNSGNGANSSLDMMVNDYIYYYEKNLRAGKVGIPAGVFSGSPLSTHVEGYYSKEFSKALLHEGLTASINFFNGTHYASETEGLGIDDYLDYLDTMRDGTELSETINDQFEVARTQADALNDNFVEQVETDNTMMLQTYDALQQNVVYLKVDMLQALNINVDYVDADGD